MNRLEICEIAHKHASSPAEHTLAEQLVAVNESTLDEFRLDFSDQTTFAEILEGMSNWERTPQGRPYFYAAWRHARWVEE